MAILHAPPTTVVVQEPPRTLRPTPTIPRQAAPELVAQAPSAPELDTIASQWQLALDAGERALSAAAGTLPASYLTQRRRELVRERLQTAEMLVSLAQVRGIRPVPWLSPVPVSTMMLGLPAGVSACLFDLDGVLTDSAVLHSLAWGEVFDDLLLRLTENTGWQFIPFDRGADYRAYIDGRPRLGSRLPRQPRHPPTGGKTR